MSVAEVERSRALVTAPALVSASRAGRFATLVSSVKCGKRLVAVSTTELVKSNH